MGRPHGGHAWAQGYPALPATCRLREKFGFILFLQFPPGSCRQGDRGSPGSIGTRDVPADFLTVAGGADMEMSSLRGSGGPRPGPLPPGLRDPLCSWSLWGKSRSSIRGRAEPRAGRINPWRAAGPLPLLSLCPRTPSGSARGSPRQLMAAGKSKVVRQTNKLGKIEGGEKKIEIFLPTRGEKAQRSTRIHQPLLTAADRASRSTWDSFWGNFSGQVCVFTTSLEWVPAKEQNPARGRCEAAVPRGGPGWAGGMPGPGNPRGTPEHPRGPPRHPQGPPRHPRGPHGCDTVAPAAGSWGSTPGGSREGLRRAGGTRGFSWFVKNQLIKNPPQK